jgi:DNA polymerase-3 subunit gamma/tau
VHSVLGTAADDRVVEIASAALAKDARRALELVASSADEGLQLGELLDQLIDYWRGLMLLHTTGGEAGDLDLAEPHRETARQQARALTLDTILAGLDVLATTKARLRSSAHGQVLLEMAVVRLSRLDELVPVSQLAQWLSQPGSGPPAAARPATPGPTAEESKKNGTTGLAESFRIGSNGSAAQPTAATGLTPVDASNLYLVWDKVKIGCGVLHAAELTKASLPAIIGPKTLAVRFPSRYNHAYEYCREPVRAQLLEGLLKKQTGQDWAVRFEVEPPTAATEPAGPPPATNRERARMALESPLLSRIISHLDGRLLKMDEGFGEQSPAADNAEAAPPANGEPGA